VKEKHFLHAGCSVAGLKDEELMRANNGRAGPPHFPAQLELARQAADMRCLHRYKQLPLATIRLGFVMTPVVHLLRRQLAE